MTQEDEIFEKRLAICKGCDQFDAEAFNGGGRCKACGCPIQSKLRRAYDACPIRKWASEVIPSSETGNVEPDVEDRLKLPAINVMAKSFFSSVIGFASSGFKKASVPQIAGRLKSCQSCPYWDMAGFAGTGQCRKCGCSTKAKLIMATEVCPVGRWGVDPSVSA